VCLGDLAFFATRGGFGNGGGLGTTSSFDTLCSGSAGGIFGLAESAAHGRVSIFRLMGTGCLSCMTCGRLCGSSGSFRFSLAQQRLLAYLLGGAVS